MEKKQDENMEDDDFVTEATPSTRQQHPMWQLPIAWRATLGSEDNVVPALAGDADMVRIWNRNFTDTGRTHCITDDAGCWLVMRCAQPKGYVVVKDGGNSVKGYPTLAHGFSALFWKGVRARAGEQVSHLCCHPACVRPSHLVIESVQYNNSRKGCPGDIVCACGEIAYSCPHRPKCVSNCKNV